MWSGGLIAAEMVDLVWSLGGTARSRSRMGFGNADKVANGGRLVV